jgi:hypothetical protein
MGNILHLLFNRHLTKITIEVFHNTTIATVRLWTWAIVLQTHVENNEEEDAALFLAAKFEDVVVLLDKLEEMETEDNEVWGNSLKGGGPGTRQFPFTPEA